MGRYQCNYETKFRRLVETAVPTVAGDDRGYFEKLEDYLMDVPQQPEVPEDYQLLTVGERVSLLAARDRYRAASDALSLIGFAENAGFDLTVL